MNDLNQLLLEYVMTGGKYPATFLRGYSDAGRFGVRGEGAGIPEEERDAYAAGGAAAQKTRQQFMNATSNTYLAEVK